MRAASPHHAPGLNRHWFERDGGKRLAHDRELVAEQYPHLLYSTAERVNLRGPLIFPSESGIMTRIAIRIDFPIWYPQCEPLAYDDEKRFPADLDRHLLTDWRCCLWLPTRSRWKPYDPDALLGFLDEVALFFDRQLIYDATGRKKWPGGEYPHRRAGYVEFLKETLVVDQSTLDALAPVLLNRLRPERNGPCPCGSGRKFKKCHALPIWDVQRTIPPEWMTNILS